MEWSQNHGVTHHTSSCTNAITLAHTKVHAQVKKWTSDDLNTIERVTFWDANYLKLFVMEVIVMAVQVVPVVLKLVCSVMAMVLTVVLAVVLAVVLVWLLLVVVMLVTRASETRDWTWTTHYSSEAVATVIF